MSYSVYMNDVREIQFECLKRNSIGVEEVGCIVRRKTLFRVGNDRQLERALIVYVLKGRVT